MKFETLKSDKRKKYIIGIIIFIAIMATISLVGSRAKYRTTQSIPLARGKINYILGDVNILGIYLQNDTGYEKVESIPDSGYEFNVEKSYCNIGEEKQDVTINYDMNTKSLSITPITNRKNRCYLYFDKQLLAKDVILANMPTQTTRTDFSQVLTTDTPGTIYKANDNDGESYYFAGAASDNWIKFGKNKENQDLYWRIIRINGDETIRLIYSGTSTLTTGTGTQIGKSAFNSTVTNNAYTGYMYENNFIHGLKNDSTIKGILDTWYDNNLSNNASFIDSDAGFCGDRDSYIDSNGITVGGGIGEKESYYGSYLRLVTKKTPKLVCDNESDLYTTNISNKGNKKLMRPIGLISADEVAFAGGVHNTSNSYYYIYSKQYYWTMSPSCYDATDNARVFYLTASGYLVSSSNVSNVYGIRPVINLRADVTLTGTGTSSDPYIVS